MNDWLAYCDRFDGLKGAIAHWAFFEPLVHRILDRVPAGGRILDVGCAVGYTAIALASHGREAVGIDNNIPILTQANTNAVRYGSPAQFQLGDALDLKEHFGLFDLVYSVGLMEHFPYALAVRILQDMGRCAPLVLNVMPLPWKANVLDGVEANIEWERHSARQQVQMMRDAGFEILDVQGMGDIQRNGWFNFLRLALPRAAYRYAQNHGFASGLAVLGRVK